jgi:streptogramin lyase
VKFTPSSGTLTAYLAPFRGKASCVYYGRFVTQAGEVWVTILAENGLVRLDVKAMNAIKPLANGKMGKVWMGYDPQSRALP